MVPLTAREGELDDKLGLFELGGELNSFRLRAMESKWVLLINIQMVKKRMKYHKSFHFHHFHLR